MEILCHGSRPNTNGTSKLTRTPTRGPRWPKLSLSPDRLHAWADDSLSQLVEKLRIAG